MLPAFDQFDVFCQWRRCSRGQGLGDHGARGAGFPEPVIAANAVWQGVRINAAAGAFPYRNNEFMTSDRPIRTRFEQGCTKLCLAGLECLDLIANRAERVCQILRGLGVNMCHEASLPDGRERMVNRPLNPDRSLKEAYP